MADDEYWDFKAQLLSGIPNPAAVDQVRRIQHDCWGTLYEEHEQTTSGREVNNPVDQREETLWPRIEHPHAGTMAGPWLARGPTHHDVAVDEVIQ
eukprot:3018369-Pyramimonas_sp.AAC.1